MFRADIFEAPLGDYASLTLLYLERTDGKN